ncbi:MAG: hypothetical protein VST72_05730 [Nitrospirota bacterium]|nr:hypothetical protein [Nitrospirota bacterium]
MKKTTETEKKSRRPYNRPKIEQVQLIAEEAVLTTCKTTGGVTGPTTTCTGKGDCSIIGS